MIGFGDAFVFVTVLVGGLAAVAVGLHATSPAQQSKSKEAMHHFKPFPRFGRAP